MHGGVDRAGALLRRACERVAERSGLAIKRGFATPATVGGQDPVTRCLHVRTHPAADSRNHAEWGRAQSNVHGLPRGRETIAHHGCLGTCGAFDRKLAGPALTWREITGRETT